MTEEQRQLELAWESIAGKFADESKAVKVYKGVVTVLVSHPVICMEIHFIKRELVKRLRELMSDVYIDDVRFRVGIVKRL